MNGLNHTPLVIHGWTVFVHPLFTSQLDALAQQVGFLKERDPVGYVKKNAVKRLAAITKLAFDVIPQDPTRPEYRQGNALGEEHKHWFRAKFFQQYRLFFRYHVASKVIVLAWVNDEDTKRAYESSEDAYRVFRKMLESGHPPDDWSQLIDEAQGVAVKTETQGNCPLRARP
ncbi:MAG: type II toxin-antitoxin system YhaV family toxin [Rhodoferax sp.]